MRNLCHRTLKLDPEEWQRLEQLAQETNSRPREGIHAYQTTWPALIRRIARGELIVLERNPDVKRARQLRAIDEAIAQNEKAARKLPAFDQLSLLEHEPA